MGRKKIIDKGPRNIDLDILLYDDEVVNHERLKIPHPLMYEREFVLRPLSEYIPSSRKKKIEYRLITSDLSPGKPWIQPALGN